MDIKNANAGALTSLNSQLSSLQKRVTELEVERGTGPQWQPRLNGHAIAALQVPDLVALAGYYEAALECTRASLQTRRMVEERETENAFIY